MQAFGSTKDEHQKLVIPAMTVLISRRCPANEGHTKVPGAILAACQW
ncbi:unnamed protein product [Brassica rapa subsp. narinosa]